DRLAEQEDLDLVASLHEGVAVEEREGGLRRIVGPPRALDEELHRDLPSEDWPLDVAPEHVAETRDDLPEGGAGLDELNRRRHEVDRGVGGLGGEAIQELGDA